MMLCQRHLKTLELFVPERKVLGIKENHFITKVHSFIGLFLGSWPKVETLQGVTALAVNLYMDLNLEMKILLFDIRSHTSYPWLIQDLILTDHNFS
jgi:hypothetical protein